VAAARLINVKVGDVKLAVETVPAAGSELTFGRKAEGKAELAFAHAQQAILEVARKTAELIDVAAAMNARPDQLELEFGLRFSAGGDVILAGATDQSSLHVTLTYNAAAPPAQAPLAGGPPAAGQAI
jgi:hypothetical protein